MIFEPDPEPDPMPRRAAESYARYLTRSSHSIAKAIRKLLDAWVAEYPEIGRADLLSRFRFRDDTIFLSTFFELYLFILLSMLGYGTEVHPSLSESGEKRPDFLLHGPDRERFYLEATLATETSAGERGRQALRDVVIDILNDMESPNFFIDVKIRDLPKSAPSTPRLKRDLRQWLDSLDPDLCLEVFRRSTFAHLPEFEWEHDGWRVKFQAHPKSAGLRGKANVRTVGIQYDAARRVDPAKALRKALKSKISRYGRLDHPYVVAVNFTEPYADLMAVEKALFGAELVSVAEDQTGEFSLGLEKAGDGVLIGGGKPRNTRLSAVLIATSLHPTTIASTDSSVYLYHNPWAKRPYRGPLNRLTHFRVEEGRYVRIPGLSGKDILGVDPSWLYEES